MDDLSLVCPHGTPTEVACLACTRTDTPLAGAMTLCPHSYANPANCPDCTPPVAGNKTHRRGKATPSPPPVTGSDCAVCALPHAQHTRTNALVLPDQRHDYQPKGRHNEPPLTN